MPACWPNWRRCPTTAAPPTTSAPPSLADPTGEVRATAEGRCHGVILRERRGAGGFGYDPLFLIPEYHQTFGELMRPRQARPEPPRPRPGEAAAGRAAVVGRLAASYLPDPCPCAAGLVRRQAEDKHPGAKAARHGQGSVG